MNHISIASEISEALADGSPVALGASGGKDSCMLGLATNQYLDEIGHRGPRILIHSDLGRVEWKDSLPTCQRLADRLSMELVVVRRQAGDMMDRWLVRWRNNVSRYANLECVKLILPWSTPSMRFCTSELKMAVICRELIRRFPGQTIISASGIRREESANRAKAPIFKAQPRLTSKTHQTKGFDWHPILDWTIEDVFLGLDSWGFPLHEAYTKYGSSRVSCAFCILGSKADIKAAATCTDNHDIYREMVDLEIESAFSFQAQNWLGDVAPELLTDEQRAGLSGAKHKAWLRDECEKAIPKHLLYTKGWPTVMPTYSEAELLANIRKTVADTMHFAVEYLTAESIIERYAELIATS